MTKNFNALLTEHKAKLASIYAEKNYEALGSFQYLKNNPDFNNLKPYEGIWHMFFIDKENCYIHKNFFARSELLINIISLINYKYYPADPLESFGLTSATEDVKKYVQQEFGNPHTTGFLEISLKDIEARAIFRRNLGNLLECEFLLHDSHYNFTYLRAQKKLLRERFSCDSYTLLMLAQLSFPALLDINLYGCTLVAHNFDCEKCSNTNKHNLLINVSDRIKTVLGPYDLSCPSYQELQRVEYYLSYYRPKLYSVICSNTKQIFRTFLLLKTIRKIYNKNKKK